MRTFKEVIWLKKTCFYQVKTFVIEFNMTTFFWSLYQTNNSLVYNILNQLFNHRCIEVTIVVASLGLMYLLTSAFKYIYLMILSDRGSRGRQAWSNHVSMWILYIMLTIFISKISKKLLSDFKQLHFCFEISLDWNGGKISVERRTLLH